MVANAGAYEAHSETLQSTIQGLPIQCLRFAKRSCDSGRWYLLLGSFFHEQKNQFVFHRRELRLQL